MQIQLSAPKIWLATESIDFRSGINKLSEYVVNHFHRGLDDQLYIFYNRSKDKLKLLAQHRHGVLLIQKQLHKKKFTLKPDNRGLIEIDEKALSWLLSGLDWMTMSEFPEEKYDDYF